MPKRLALFLDGTWNNADDSTNVLNAYTLTEEGQISDEWVQKRYYDQGVGTGLLDGVTGGGFGLGLDANVRQAYNWLVDHHSEDDEVYIFGYSRGAYTARSLVGFIAACGLLQRGAPLNVNQLWEGYTFISENRSKNDAWWKETLKKKPYYFRRISHLKFDPWNGGRNRGSDLNEAEKLLVDWSRRIRITYLGIFDTVGALGWQALSIPGLRGKLAAKHNPYPTKIISSCRHALAIDENRSSFRLTPFLNYIHNKKSNVKEDEYNNDENRILQKWFIGVHSNIGGGYPNNSLTLRPLDWMLEGAQQMGLNIKKYPEPGEETVDLNTLQDSYQQFAAPFWVHILREKRYYRVIDRPDFSNSTFSLRTLNEEVDKYAVERLQDESNNYAPPNLVNYLNRKNGHSYTASFDWLAKGKVAPFLLIFWSIIATYGVQSIFQLYFAKELDLTPYYFTLFVVLWIIIDWGEAHYNFKSALDLSNIKAKVLQSVFYWMRLSGVIAFFIGFVSFLKELFRISASGNIISAPLIQLIASIGLSGLAAILTISLLKRKKVAALFKASLADLFSFIVILFFGLFILQFIFYLFGVSIDSGSPIPNIIDLEIKSGLLLFFQSLMIIFALSFQWVGRPTNLLKDSIVSLQKIYRKSQLDQLLHQWTKKVTRNWRGEQKEIEARNKVKAIIDEALWIDNLALIPTYTISFLLIICLGLEVGHPKLLPYLPYFIIAILITAAADYLENHTHFKHLERFAQKNQASGALTKIGFIASIVKFILFIPTLLLSLFIIGKLTIDILGHPGTAGGRWQLVHITTIIFSLLIVSWLFFVINRIRSKKSKSKT